MSLIPKFKIKLKNNTTTESKKIIPKSKIQLKKPRLLSEEFPMKKIPSDMKEYSLMSTLEKGDLIVRWVYNWLSAFDVISELVNTSGISNNRFDIVVRTIKDNQLRGVQVKTLTYSNRQGIDFWASNISGCDYPDDTLMIFLNPEQTRFCVAFWKDIPGSKNYLGLEFGRNDTPNESIKFINIQVFQKQNV